ncbi:hypothetical protein [uncultured Tateyamaria sp.]|uniref:hypothetical protein n=1 Tax=uncultured Tateyamaria sp. TaxID=455651 RepID=UPI0026171D4B|nr:hypothetical protein [uncultured Tateyamaria sp.]
MQRNPRCERAQHKSGTSGLGSFETFAALCLNGRFVESARALSVPKFEFSTLNALATVALRC